MRVAVIGLGSIGFAVAEYLLSAGVDVVGIEVDMERSRAVKEKLGISVHSHMFGAKSIDFWVVCVYDLGQINCVLADFSWHRSRPNVIVESTVPLSLVSRMLLCGYLRIAYFPHRWMQGDPEHGVKQPRMFGCSQEDILVFDEYLKSVGLREIATITDPFVAVASKLTENAHRYMEIVLAQELAEACKRTSMSFEQLRLACNTKWNINIKEVRDGVGGHCLPKDMEWFIEAFPAHSLARVFVALNERFAHRGAENAPSKAV